VKFAKPKSKPSKDSLADRVEGKSKSVPSWMKTDPDEVKELEEAQKTAMFSSRPPEFFLSEDETRNIRFTSETYVACAFQYSIPVPGKKYWRKVTQPDEGDKDLLAEAGKSASLRAIYEIIDVTGYKDKKTSKRIKNIRRFWNMSMKQHEAIQKMREKKGTLLDREWSVTKVGSGKQSTMMIMPEERSSMTSEQKETKSLKKDFQRYYAPPDFKTQKLLLRGLDKSHDEE
jgi:hypothetical protein